MTGRGPDDGSPSVAPDGVDVAYQVLDATPIGPVLVAVADRGLVRTAFDAEGFDAVLDQLTEKVGPVVVETDDGTGEAVRQLREYFAGERTRFDLPLDLRLVKGFHEQVIRHLADIPYGRTESYGEVAAAVGNPRAMRAVGTACSRNPLPVVLPCHRVVRADGSVGGFMGGKDTTIKAALLALERS